jgi:prepilin-type N-terminal cleavage/methylation domain-containing protein
MKRAFTLIELLVVVAIIGLLGTLSVVSFSNSREKARVAAGQLSSKMILDSLADDAIGVWGFDECQNLTVYDLSGLQHNGEVITVAQGKWTKDTPFNNGCALAFDGVWDYIDTDYTWVTRLNNFTASAWIKTSSTDDGYIVSNGTVHPLALDPSGVLRLCSDSDQCINGTRKLNDGKWHFIAVTGDSKTIRAYIDGSAKVEATIDSLPGVTTGKLHIAHCSLGGYNFKGLLDEVRVYQQSLTATEIQELYAKGAQKINLVKR